ncbi:putative GNAT domain, acyl-CoA N-acyltransferase [Septoria linicola]|nr:putative GNAT domain, acyl-CoA N-acyltransferase [Septoria linicola]
MSIEIRAEQPTDIPAIKHVVEAAFAVKSHLNHQENKIIDQLRGSDKLSISLVAVQNERIVGYIAVSPVTIETQSGDIVHGWYGGGPLAVLPECHRTGIGGKLIAAARDELVKRGAQGCVALGIPEYYQRFGFERDEGLKFEGAPGSVFTRVKVTECEDERVEGVVKYAEGWIS